MSILQSTLENPSPSAPKGIIYGPPGIGKTTFGASAEGSIIIDCENGAGAIRCSRTPYLATWPEIEKWLTAIEQEGKARAQQGRPPIGADGPYKLVEGRKRREWTFESDAEFVLKHHLGEQAFEKALLSPAKAEKALGSGVDISDLIRQLPGAPTLVPATDKREPLPSADGDFDNLEQS